MNRAILLLGGNIGDTMYYLEKSKEFLENKNCLILSSSHIYETEAWGVKDQQNYLNQGFLIETTLSPNELLKACLKTEQQLGRVRKKRWGARTIDIDIIFYNNIILETEKLTIPHPRYHLRNFVLHPLNDLAPSFLCPFHKKEIHHLKKNSLDQLMVKRHFQEKKSIIHE